MHVPGVILSISCVIAVLAVSQPVAADPAGECAAAKLNAVIKAAKKKTGCIAKALKKGEPVDPRCLAKIELKLAADFHKAESKGGCATNGNDGIAENLVDEFVTNVSTLLSGHGALCTVPDECPSGHCVDGVCCHVACDTSCLSCAGAETELSDGICGAMLISGDPDFSPVPLCANGVGCAASTCACNGAGQCLGSAGATGCTSGKQCLTGVCNAGTCTSESKESGSLKGSESTGSETPIESSETES